MSFILDAVILILCALTVLIGYKRGFFKSFMTLCSGIASLMIAYAFSPAVSAWLKAKYLLDGLADGIMDTLASMAGTGAEASYDLSKLLENNQFLSMLNQYGANSAEITELIRQTGEGSRAAVEKVAYAVADPIAQTISDIIAFFGLFLVSLIVLRLLTWALGLIFQLPVLHTMDKTLGLVFGIVSALLFVWVFSLVAGTVLDALSSIAPSSFDPAILEDSVLLQFFARYNPLGLAAAALLG